MHLVAAGMRYWSPTQGSGWYSQEYQSIIHRSGTADIFPPAGLASLQPAAGCSIWLLAEHNLPRWRTASAATGQPPAELLMRPYGIAAVLQTLAASKLQDAAGYYISRDCCSSQGTQFASEASQSSWLHPILDSIISALRRDWL